MKIKNIIKRQILRFVHWELIIINLIGLVAGIFLYYLFGEKVEIIGAVLAATISISIGLTNYKIEGDKIFKELFESYNKKYDSKYNDRLNEITDETDKVDETLIVDYLNFCSEEFLWFKRGRIPYTVWKAWREGIIFHLKKQPIKIIIDKERKQKDSYYGLFENVDL